MLELTKEQLRQLQLTELEMLCEVRRICDKHDISYQIIAGTLLGAVRHGGFIPWDDDADVAMLRPEYERFRKACRTELDTSRFEFQDDRNTPGYRWGYGKLRRKNTLFLREHQENMPYFQGVFIDIFPLDEVPSNYLFRAIWNAECFVVRKTLWSRVGKEADKNPAGRKLFWLLDRIPEEKVLAHYHSLIRRSAKLEKMHSGECAWKHFKERTWKHLKEIERKHSSLFDKIGQISDFALHKQPFVNQERWVRILMFPTPNRAYGYRRKWYKKSADYLFEGETFKGIAEADEYLSFKFGNYMELPPKEQRKVHPVSDLKLPVNRVR